MKGEGKNQLLDFFPFKQAKRTKSYLQNGGKLSLDVDSKPNNSYSRK
jgi:hypothetical protein